MAYEINMAVFVGKSPTLHRASGFRLPQQRNSQRQPEKEKPFGIQPSGFLLDGLAFRLPNPSATFNTTASPLRSAEWSILFSGKSVRLSDDAQSATSSHAPKKGCAVREVCASRPARRGRLFLPEPVFVICASGFCIQ